MKSEIIKAIEYLEKKGLIKGTWGNLSIKIKDKIYITPSGVPYDILKEEDISVMDFESQKHISGLKPSSEKALHFEIYKNFPEIKAVVHTHSLYASIYSALRKPVPCYIEDQAQIIGGEIPVAEYKLPGTLDLALEAVKKFKIGVYGILLANHGIVSIGRNLKEALIAAEIIEKSANIAYHVELMGEGYPLSEEDIKWMRNLYIASYSKNI
ncbi:L-fuculose-phosphate aldolase [Marinitoga hydrogenitolerans DSM 16785]|uniref:L-fuculose-phosphate aldolase n=1 Tax=Marinitoga hydrogenitolerans (strain DSM 16785 / JCM 12826 / AT1271) TaxID=1122195 RepID=A0A1M4WKT5_MARH1|nr:class II aldolase/adducin family protein [Marinitoga hydrogenitolerans]SHE81770.1 L-fuculose-phosphate aldolase [Marinitoga hydrogenitolerans DSM 16785]